MMTYRAIGFAGRDGDGRRDIRAFHHLGSASLRASIRPANHGFLGGRTTELSTDERYFSGS